MNTIQYSPRSGPLYAIGLSLRPHDSSTQTASRSLQPFLQVLLGNRPTDIPTDHATLSVTIGGILLRCSLIIIIIVAYLDSQTGFHACIGTRQSQTQISLRPLRGIARLTVYFLTYVQLMLILLRFPISIDIHLFLCRRTPLPQ